MGKSRRAIPLSVRFEVFKRDSFMCRYCGRRPPEIELVIEHVIAVANGGTNDPANLLASCGACNLGKSVRPVEVGQLPPVSDESIARMEADLERLRRMAAIQREIDENVSDLWWRFTETWTRLFRGEITMNPDGTRRATCVIGHPDKEAIKGRLREGVHIGTLLEAAEATSRAFYSNRSDLSGEKIMRYFFGCVRNRVNEGSGGGGC